MHAGSALQAPSGLMPGPMQTGCLGSCVSIQYGASRLSIMQGTEPFATDALQHFSGANHVALWHASAQPWSPDMIEHSQLDGLRASANRACQTVKSSSQAL